MTSLKSLAAAERLNPKNSWDNTDRHTFEAAVLEIAHAIRRGRKPNSCSVLPGQNIQDWLRRTFVETTHGCHDFMGDECSIADDTRDALYGWFYNNPEAMAICRAIDTCSRYLRPIKKEADIRGDWQYQDRNKVTNRKRKADWLRRREGSDYDDFDYFDEVDEGFHGVGRPLSVPDDDDPAPTTIPTGTVRRIRRASVVVSVKVDGQSKLLTLFSI